MDIEADIDNFSSPSANLAKAAKVEPIALNDLTICWTPGGEVMAAEQITADGTVQEPAA